jgi:hypothetical protein
MLFVTQNALGHDVGLSVIAVSAGDFAAPLSVATLPSEINHAPRKPTGSWEPSWDGRGPGTYYFAFSYQNFDDTTASTYAGIATPGSPVTPVLIQNYRPALVDGTSPVLFWADRFDFVEDILSPTSTRTALISVPTLAGFGMADVTKREIQVTARPYLLAQTPFDGTGRDILWLEQGDGTPEARWEDC